MATAYLGLGSDLGNRLEWLRAGIARLQAAGLEISAVSSLYLTEPVGDPGLPWFLNCVAAVADAPEPRELIRLCLQIEAACGRRRSGPGVEARSLDIDVLLYDLRRIEEPELTLPHPRLHLRRFVLRPLAEIAPDAVHPGLGRSIAELLEALDVDDRVWLLAPFPEGARNGRVTSEHG